MCSKLVFIRCSHVLTEQVVVGISLVLEGQSSIADVVQILQPLKIRHCYATSVQVHVLHNQQ